MKNIAIIESFSDDSRKPKWEAVKIKFAKSYSFHSVENQIETFINAIPNKSIFILFAHLGDTQDFNEALYQKCIDSNVVLIQYTGGVSQYQISANSIENIHFDMLMDNIEIFLSHCQFLESITEYDLQKLIGFDPKLEAQLELLHQCLTPAGAASANKINNYTLIDADVENVKIGEQNILEYLGKQPNCFDEEKYIKPLTALRKKLLGP